MQAKEADTRTGAAPFGMGLQRWLKYSPLFNVDSVTALGPLFMTFMWATYAAMRYLCGPVEFILFNR